MSNFTCPTCGLTNIDCGKAGYKTTREIELEIPQKENAKLRRLLEECVPYVTFKVNIEKNIGCTPPGAYLLTCIKDALGESEERF